MKKILITGGTGFIGRFLIEELSKSGFEILAPKSDELNSVCADSWHKYDKENIEHVVHLAGKTFVPDSWEIPECFMSVNISGTANALSYCKRNGCSMTFISAYVYGKQDKLPIREDAHFTPNNPYAESKYLSEQLCEFYSKAFGINVNVLRLFNVYGPGQKSSFLIPRLIEQIKSSGQSIEVMDLKPRRDYVFVEDVCKAIRLSIDNCSGYEVFNVGSGKSYSVEEVIELLQKLSGTNKCVRSLNNVRTEEINDVVADISKIKSRLEWIPSTKFEEGLKKCLCL